MRPSKAKCRLKKVKSFARLPGKPFAIRGNLYRNRTNHQIPASTMKTLLIACLCSLALTLTSLAQSPAPPQTAPPGLSPAASPGAPVAASPGAPAAVNPAAPAQLGGSPPAGPAVPPPGVATSPAATVTATL